MIIFSLRCWPTILIFVDLLMVMTMVVVDVEGMCGRLLVAVLVEVGVGSEVGDEVVNGL